MRKETLPRLRARAKVGPPIGNRLLPGLVDGYQLRVLGLALGLTIATHQWAKRKENLPRLKGRVTQWVPKVLTLVDGCQLRVSRVSRAGGQSCLLPVSINCGF